VALCEAPRGSSQEAGADRWSKESGGQGSPVGASPWILGIEGLEQVEELLASNFVCLDSLQELIESCIHIRGRGTHAGQGGHMTSLWSLWNALEQLQSLVVRASLHQQGGQGNHGSLVIRLDLQSLAQGVLVPGCNQLLDLGCLGQEPGDEILHHRLALSAHEAVHHLGVPQSVHSRDGLDLEGSSSLGVLVHVDLGQFHLAVGGCHHLLQYWAEHPARSTPRGPEIHYYRDTLGALQYRRGKGFIGYIHHHCQGSVQRMNSDPEGIDKAAVTAWMLANVTFPDGTKLGAPLRFELIAGGRSNLTYKIEDARGKRVVLRRPPLGELLPTAHDMAREYRILSALGPLGLPVPQTLALCTDSQVNQRPFYVMSYIEGVIARDVASAEVLSLQARRRCGLELADVLARLHSLDVEAAGLGDLGRHEGYMERQLKRWHQQFHMAQIPADAETTRLVDELHEELLARIPAQQGFGIVHGDYRLDNAVLSPAGEVLGILDWELCTLGDPLADLGMLMVYWAEPGDPLIALTEAPTVLEGFATRDELVARYALGSSRDLSALPYYRAFGYWKLACILHGVLSRYKTGGAAGDRSEIEGFESHVTDLAREGARQLS
jgi:aminoglycoside phosphotransferase (APT) family kinase protein